MRKSLPMVLTVLAAVLVASLFFLRSSKSDLNGSYEKQSEYCSAPFQKLTRQPITVIPEASARFRRSISQSEVKSFVYVQLMGTAGRCFGYARVSTAHGTSTMDIFGSSAQIRKYRPFLISYLRHSVLFDEVRKL
jgi:hypothetical protein